MSPKFNNHNHILEVILSVVINLRELNNTTEDLENSLPYKKMASYDLMYSSIQS